MYAGAGDFPHGEQATQGRSAPCVGLDAAHPVVGRGGDGHGRGGPVEPEAAAGGVDGGETPGKKRRAQGGGVEQHRSAALLRHLPGDAAGNHIARGKLGVRVQRLHKAGAVLRAEHSAVATNGLGNKEVAGNGESGRVELVELDIGHLHTGAQGHGYTVAGGHRGVGGVGKKLARAAAGEENGIDREGALVAVLVQNVDTGHASVFNDEVAGERVLQHLDAGRPHGGDEGGFNREAGCVAAGVEHAGVRVRRFQTTGELALAAVEVDTKGDQVANAGGALAAQDFDGLEVAQAGPGAQGI